MSPRISRFGQADWYWLARRGRCGNFHTIQCEDSPGVALNIRISLGFEARHLVSVREVSARQRQRKRSGCSNQRSRTCLSNARQRQKKRSGCSNQGRAHASRMLDSVKIREVCAATKGHAQASRFLDSVRGRREVCVATKGRAYASQLLDSTFPASSS